VAEQEIILIVVAVALEELVAAAVADVIMAAL
jgi:hypothetical protein